MLSTGGRWRSRGPDASLIASDKGQAADSLNHLYTSSDRASAHLTMRVNCGSGVRKLGP